VLENAAITLFGLEQCFAGLRPLNGIDDGPRDQLAVHPAFDQIILRPGMDGFQGPAFVVHAAEDNDGHIVRLGFEARKVSMPGGFGQRQIQHHHINAWLFKTA
jgi:hypothetical protein